MNDEFTSSPEFSRHRHETGRGIAFVLLSSLLLFGCAGEHEPVVEIDTNKAVAAGSNEMTFEWLVAQPVDNVSFSETPLSDVLDYLHDLHRLEFDTSQLVAAGLDPASVNVTYQPGDSGLPTDQMLRETLRTHGIGIQLRDQKVVLFKSESK